MGILATLNKEKFGSWGTLLAYLQDLNRRESGALAALNSALAATPDEQRELGQGDGMLVLSDVAADARVQKGARLAAIRCAMEAAISGPLLVTMYVGGGDLATDPRLGAHAKKFVEQGIPAALADPIHPATRVSLLAGALGRALVAAASVVGQARLKELIAGAPAGHAGVNAALFGLGLAPLPPAELEVWKRLLRDACAANKRAPAAARRIGMAPPWPPIVPDAFKDLVAEAEKAAANVVSIDATKGGVITGRAGPAGAQAAPPMPVAVAASVPVPNAPAIKARVPSAPRAGSLGAPLQPKPPPDRNTLRAPPARAPPAPPASAASAAAAKAPPKGKSAPATAALVAPAKADPSAPRLQEPLKRGRGRKQANEPEAPIIAATRHMPPLMAQSTPATAAAAPPPPAPPKPEPIAPSPLERPMRQFDGNGRARPTVDRWKPQEYSWEEPILPPSELRPPARVLPPPGPFARRLRSLLDDKPEAVDRLLAAAEGRCALVGAEALSAELRRELDQPAWKDARAPAAQLQRLRVVADDAERPEPWRLAARLILDRLGQGAR